VLPYHESDLDGEKLKLGEGDDCFHFYFFDDSESSLVFFSKSFWTYDVEIVLLDSVHEFCSGPISGEASPEKLVSELRNGF
jgi:hypothetical protein